MSYTSSRIEANNLDSPLSGDTLHLSFGKTKQGTGQFTLHQFRDHDHFIAYIPSLNISAYGETEDEAFDRMVNVVLVDFFESILELGPEQAKSELKKLGWSQHRFFKRQFKANSFVDRNGVLKNFNLPEETKVDTTVVTV